MSEQSKPSSKEPPTYITMGIYKEGNKWYFVKHKIKGKQIMSFEKADHTLRAFAFDTLKIEAVKEFLKDELV